MQSDLLGIQGFAAPLIVAALCLFTARKLEANGYLLLWGFGLVMFTVPLAISAAIGRPATIGEFPIVWLVASMAYTTSNAALFFGVLILVGLPLGLRGAVAACLAVAAAVAVLQRLHPFLMEYASVGTSIAGLLASGVLLLARARSAYFVFAGLWFLARAATAAYYAIGVIAMGRITLGPGDAALISFNTLVLGLVLLLLAFDESQRGLQRAHAAERDAKLLAERADRAKSNFLANMSHELRTPLNAVIGYGEFLRSLHPGPLGAKQREYVDSILTAGRHVLSLVDDVLDLSRIEAGRMPIEPERARVDAVLNEAVRDVLPRAQAGGLSVRTRLVPAEAHVDRRAVGQIARNLLSNAVKFTRPGGTIDVSLDADGDRVAFEVRDSGIGIAPERLATLFEPFGSGSAYTARDGAGAGLGLSISRALAELSGGTLEISSEVGVGTLARVRLPRGLPSCEAAAAQ